MKKQDYPTVTVPALMKATSIGGLSQQKKDFYGYTPKSVDTNPL